MSTNINNMKKTYFLGNIQHGMPPTGGGAQAKNQMFLSFLQRNVKNLVFYDTWKKNHLTSLLMLFYYILKAKKDENVILSISFPGAFRIAQLFSLLHIKRRVFYWVIGGDIPDDVQKLNEKQRGYLHFYYKIIVQADYLLKDLLKMGLDNTDLVYNFKVLPNITIDKKSPNTKLRFVYLARLIPEKGVDVIIESFKQLKDIDIEVDFYGSLNSPYTKEYFENLEDKRIQYKGFLNLKTEEGYKVLSSYDVFLFPTYFNGEGFPGVLIDAYISGLPVIVSDFHANPEVVKEGETGFIIPPRDVDALSEKIRYFVSNPHIIPEMSNKAQLKAKEFDIENVLSEASNRFNIK